MFPGDAPLHASLPVPDGDPGCLTLLLLIKYLSIAGPQVFSHYKLHMIQHFCRGVPLSQVTQGKHLPMQPTSHAFCEDFGGFFLSCRSQ